MAEHGQAGGLTERLWELAERYYIPFTVLAAILLWVGVMGAVLFDIQLPQAGEQAALGPAGGGGGGLPPGQLQPDVVITIYGKELPGGKFGFGLSPDEITSPGPELRVRQGQVVEIRFVNMGKVRHGLAVVQSVEKTNPTILFNAIVGPPNNPIEPGGEGSVIFVASQAGEFYYQCPVPNHGPKGMWGKFIVEPAG